MKSYDYENLIVIAIRYSINNIVIVLTRNLKIKFERNLLKMFLKKYPKTLHIL